MKDALFGELEYDLSWCGKCTWTIFGRDVITPLIISCYEPEEITDYQRHAFAAFEERKIEFTKLSEEAIFQYYLELLPEYRERFGDFADKLAPRVSDLRDMGSLVIPAEVIVQRSIGEARERIIGLLFTCTWEPELGLAVKFINEQLREVGTQDIVL